jgi:hypothetical protein
VANDQTQFLDTSIALASSVFLCMLKILQANVLLHVANHSVVAELTPL